MEGSSFVVKIVMPVSLNIPFSEEQSTSRLEPDGTSAMRTVGSESFYTRLVTSCGDGKRHSVHETFEQIFRQSSVKGSTS
jgi:hypothetical protein